MTTQIKRDDGQQKHGRKTGSGRTMFAALNTVNISPRILRKTASLRVHAHWSHLKRCDYMSNY
jgi:hypothetical protein